MSGDDAKARVPGIYFEEEQTRRPFTPDESRRIQEISHNGRLSDFQKSQDIRRIEAYTRTTRITQAKTPAIAGYVSWRASRGSSTLLLWAHGLQRPGYIVPGSSERGFVYLCPFGVPLRTTTLTQTPGRLEQIVKAFDGMLRKFDFMSPVPDQVILPFDNQDAAPVLDRVAQLGLCDICYLQALVPDTAHGGREGVHIACVDLVDFVAGIRFYMHYLLLTCRSRLDPGTQIGVATSQGTGRGGIGHDPHGFWNATGGFHGSFAAERGI